MQRCSATSLKARKLSRSMSRSRKKCKVYETPIKRKEIMSNLPIADYALMSDCRSAALVNRAGSVDWLCFPRFDGPSVFARLLDEQAGLWSIHAVGATEVSRRYIVGTMALDTTFH